MWWSLDLPIWSSLQVHNWQPGHPGGLAKPQHHPLCWEWQVVHRPSCDHPGQHTNPVQHHDPERGCVWRGPIHLLCANRQPPKNFPGPPYSARWVTAGFGLWWACQWWKGSIISVFASTDVWRHEKHFPLWNPEIECMFWIPFHLLDSWLSIEYLHSLSIVPVVLLFLLISYLAHTCWALLSYLALWSWAKTLKKIEAELLSVPLSYHL